MRNGIALILMTILALAGCGEQDSGDAATDLAPPPESASASAPAGDTHDMGLNTDISMAEEISQAWSGAVVKVVDMNGSSTLYDLPIGEDVPLGGTGLTAMALVFIPDFVMGEDGISSRSVQQDNPALRLRVTETDRPDWEGWLFATLPEIHPFPHGTYEILLVEGIPAG